MDTKKLIRITKNKVFLTTEFCLPLSQTNLTGKNLTFRTAQDIYFEVEIIGYDKTTKNISLQVIDYNPKHIEKFKEQIAKAEVLFIHFKPLRWSLLEPHLSSYTKSRLIDDRLIINDRSGIIDHIKPSGPLNPGKLSIRNLSFQLPDFNTKPFVREITESAKIYFKDADFNLGFVAFPYKSKELKNVYNLKIENDYLLPEFNAIKSFFPKAFGGKKQFNIKVVFSLTGNSVTTIVTTSPEISEINENIIDVIKQERITNLTSIPLRKSVDKSLFTSEDIFDSFHDNLKDGNVFQQSEEDILNFLIENRNVRNAKHLQFLSGSKDSAKQKIRFTLNPLFGFLFFIEGETKNHFCWELLNSHATYLWSFDKIESDVRFQFKRIEETINIIRGSGREAYKHNFRNGKVDNDLIFCTIDHSNINSAFKDGFVEWQHKLQERLL